jgi:hypothetical protein
MLGRQIIPMAEAHLLKKQAFKGTPSRKKPLKAIAGKPWISVSFKPASSWMTL